MTIYSTLHFHQINEMGRLDYFSIIIIAICVAAAAFLVYIGINFRDDDKDADALYNGMRTYDEDGKETAYTIDEDDLLESESASEPARIPSTPANTSTTPPNDEDLEYDFLDETPKSTASTETSSNTTARSTSSNSSTSSKSSASSSRRSGDYMVLAGSFRDAANAEREASRIRNLGFPNTSVERFDKGAFSVILVDRFSTRGSANDLKSQLSDKGVESYVKLKQ